MRNAGLLVTLCFVGLALPGCSTRGNADVASEAVVKFHHNLDQALYQSIMLEGDTEFKSNSWNLEYLRKAHENGGNVKNSVGGRVSSQSTGDEAQITMLYKTEFENCTAAETFVWGVKEGKARLKFYEVRGIPGVSMD
jgi:hypothetical protein